MSGNREILQHKINSATELQSIVHAMKVMAAANVSEYEKAVLALDDYYRCVQLALHTGFRQHPIRRQKQQKKQRIGILVWGSDQGLVGQFNGALVSFLEASLTKIAEEKIIFCIGERLQRRLAETQLTLAKGYILPKSLHAIPPLINKILLEMETRHAQGELSEILIFYNRPQSETIYRTFSQQLLPLDDAWQRDLKSIVWPSNKLPEVINTSEETLLAFIHEYLFVSLYRACAQSLTSENACRLATMLRAEKTIAELLETMNHRFHHLRQSQIDEELFDLIAGFELLQKK